MRRIGVVALVVAASVSLAACSGGPRGFIERQYSLDSTSGDVTTYSSRDPVGTTVTDIVGEEEPSARTADGGSEYLRYRDDIVTVSPAAGGGSSIRVEDIDGTYRSGGFAYLGPGFTPGSPSDGNAGSGRTGSAK
ncbi:DUF4247 domain-containing protein [Rhodococcus rhodnii]|uniref:DUF4247 domain-containing protein n=1 Tax=Rhodococcus rhodnii LMG 5362 TaxID=1273125 RepID=R7WRB6_9NOCA|nr:DUF4247 domain-containing protein [Rhodococcus rhodnii]EOM77815.1 hypothetical protein Rrhod_0801 [Rhodococcus rhodnii LMG 5362]